MDSGSRQATDARNNIELRAPVWSNATRGCRSTRRVPTATTYLSCQPADQSPSSARPSRPLSGPALLWRAWSSALRPVAVKRLRGTSRSGGSPNGEHRYSTQRSGPPTQTPHHPTPAECVNSLTGGPRIQPRFWPHGHTAHPPRLPHRGFPTDGFLTASRPKPTLSARLGTHGGALPRRLHLQGCHGLP